MAPVSTAQAAGLDFGTSNSTLGIWGADGPRLLPLEGEHPDIPTAIFFNFEDRKTRFGRRAKAEYIRGDEGRLMQSIKSVLGSSLVEERTAILGRRVPFKEIIGNFLAHVKEQAETAAGREISNVVLGRPVFFVDDNPEADRAAQNTLEEMARGQGFDHISFQYEPIAAALAYEQSVTQEEVVLVVDIGGGTSDFSVVRVSPDNGKKQDRADDILANTGVHIGGTDFDRLLSMAQVMPHLGYGSQTTDKKRNLPSKYYHDLSTWHCINQLYDPKILRELRDVRREAASPELVDRLSQVIEGRMGHALATYVEQGKIDLSGAQQAQLSLPLDTEDLNIPLSAQGFHNCIERSVSRINAEIKTALSQAGLRADQIHTVFLTGGTTRVPALRASFKQTLSHAKLVEGDVFGAVGLGLAVDAARKFGV
ncbi:Hsp70 family protein [Flexibacterium corallicola]|uniref:Hsp70 family protein n=1 Tax=Flexibacterium corallicola TaxID=3037259 RepID=UPI00286EE443|nr:Hsp70 family protein [Pseudovibrio sp. M1P-2-3]